MVASNYQISYGPSKVELDGGGVVKLMPRDAWANDEDFESCAQCDALFSLFLRRHHCRFCGLVFCYQCSECRLGGERACISCFNKALEAASQNQVKKSASAVTATRAAAAGAGTGNGNGSKVMNIPKTDGLGRNRLSSYDSHIRQDVSGAFTAVNIKSSTPQSFRRSISAGELSRGDRDRDHGQIVIPRRLGLADPPSKRGLADPPSSRADPATMLVSTGHNHVATESGLDEHGTLFIRCSPYIKQMNVDPADIQQTGVLQSFWL